MNPTVFENLPGEVRMALFLLSGVVISLAMLAIPKKGLRTIGKTPGLSPNWVTFWRLPILWLGVALYLTIPFAGFCVCAFALMLDRMDGKIAAALDELKDPRFPGKTTLGGWLDPFIDKLTFPPFLCIFWGKGLLVTGLMIPVLVLEIGSTLIRPPIMPDEDGKPYLFSTESRIAIFLKNKIKKTNSSGPGKIKVMSQWLCLLAVLPLDQGWMDYSILIPNVLLGISVLSGIFSILTRFRVHRSVDDVVDSVSDATTPAFRHED